MTRADAPAPSRARVADAVAAWGRHGEERALTPRDRAALDRASTPMHLAAELTLLDVAASERDKAWWSLGRQLGTDRASPTLVAAMVEGLVAALAPDVTTITSDTGAPRAREATAPPRWIERARAALLEGYACATADDARADARRGWAFARCAIPLGHGTWAVAAGHPDGEGDERDEEALAQWAATVAATLATRGARAAYVGGEGAARAALADALSFAGIRVHASGAAGASGEGAPRGITARLRRLFQLGSRT